MTIAEYLADELAKCGVKYVFGIPGGPSIPYIEAFRSAGIGFILTSDEASSGVMADVSYRLTGIPGVCHSTTGPGATNITTGCGGALLDRSAVIVLTSETESHMINRTTQMNIDHQKLFEPLTKATFRITPENACETIRSAVKICLEEYPGPVHLGLPADVASKETELKPSSEQHKEEKIYSNRVDNIAAYLGNSSRPLLAVGLTSSRLSLSSRLLSFLDEYKIPAVLTPMAKGIIPETHPCYAGILFHALSDYLENMISKSDLVIGLGYDPVEINYEAWMPWVPLLHFNTRETDIPGSRLTEQYTGHPDEWFRVLRKISPAAVASPPPEIMEVRDEMASVFKGFTGHFGPVTVMKVLQEELPAETIITADVGSHLHLLGQYWNTNGRQKIIMTNGWSGMGFGIPASLAARLVCPETNVVCITGDGGFLMTAGEIVTARRYNLPVIIVVLTDGELNLIRLKKTWQDMPPYGTLLYSGDLFGSDTFLGIKVLNADSEITMRTAINNALSMNEPVLINARIDPDDYNWLIVRR